MQPWAFPIQNDLVQQAWETFTNSGHVDPAVQPQLDPVTLRSWRRCGLRLDARANPRGTILEGPALDRVLTTHADLMAIARPFMEDVHQFVEGSGYAVLLTDSTACILDMLGDAPMVAVLREVGMRPGAYWSEGQMGTNALALALLEAMPVQIVGAEHYFKTFHHLTAVAAPIHDVRGRIIGLLAMAGDCQAATCHTLGIVMAAARAVANQLHTDMYVQETNRRLTELNSVFGAISEGVIAWNQAGKITHINSQAAEILHIKTQAALGRPIAEVVPLPPVVEEAALAAETLRDVEATFTADGRAVDCLVSLRPIIEGLVGRTGYILALRPVKRVRQLVHRLIGTQATLTLADVLGETNSMRRVRRQARIAARGTAPVLLRGEGGSGKNPLARAIHNESDRAQNPFVAINCLAIPHELMASEFLGYEGGAFRGSPAEGRPSKFELADSGTLFLNEIESLTLEMQSALLHVIETGHVMRLGSTRSIPVDVRIIAATSADLEQRVAEGSFRSHLYYRFGVFIIDLPALRERFEDLPLLVERFLARITLQMDRMAHIDEEALRILMHYPWPGNVRELEDVLERAVAHSDDGVIRPDDLPAVVRSGRVLLADSPRPQPVLSIAEAERQAIMRAGWACQGQITAMAQQLGISRTTLWRKVKGMNINLRQFKSL